MIINIIYILFFEALFGYIAQKLKLPKIIGMIFVGVLIGPSLLNLIDSSFLKIAPDIKNIALLIIIIRAGLALNLNDYKKNIKTNISMSFIPGLVECIGVALISYFMLHLTIIEALMLGSIVFATSPAVVVDRGLKLKEEGYGTNKNIPDVLISAGAMDAIFALMLFNLFLNIYQIKIINFETIISIPIHIIFGIIIGFIVGKVLIRFIELFKLNNFLQALIIFVLSLFLFKIENYFNTLINFSSLIAIIMIMANLNTCKPDISLNLRKTYKKIWSVAEIFLFVLVGTALDISYLNQSIIPSLIIITIALIIRIIMIHLVLFKTDYTKNEKLFTAIAFIPKATVQASIGAIPLLLGYSFGHTFLAISILTIIITTPLGTLGIDKTYTKLLKKDKYV